MDQNNKYTTVCLIIAIIFLVDGIIVLLTDRSIITIAKIIISSSVIAFRLFRSEHVFKSILLLGILVVASSLIFLLGGVMIAVGSGFKELNFTGNLIAILNLLIGFYLIFRNPLVTISKE